MKPWNQQVALITGAGSGLGLALARRLSADGVRLVLLDLNPDALKAVAESLPNEAHCHAINVTDASAVQQVVEKEIAAFGRIDILVNSAGITGVTHKLSHEVDLADFDKVMALNLRASLITFQAVVPFMLKNDYGRVLHIASIAGKEGNAGMLAYSASKAAVIGMTKVQGKEYAQTGVRINALAPAVIRTKLVEELPEEQVRYMTDKIPMARCGTLDEFAAMARFIVSSECSFTTGFVFDLSGGRAVY